MESQRPPENLTGSDARPVKNSQLVLCAIPIVAGMILGSATAVVMGAGTFMPIGAVLGAAAGLLIAPFHMAFLTRKPLEKAAPLLYAPACVAWVCVLPFQHPLLSMAAVGATVIIMCIVVYIVLDDLHPAGACQKCGYSLTGNTSGICPECGTPIGFAERRE